jgi:hypothetical protein
MNLPSILLIGAMKSGTTSLYLDLAQHPGIFLADDKEPHALCSDEVLTAAGRQRYAAHYARARPGQLLLDASTGYSKRPDYEDVPSRALATLPASFKVIYLVRHPIDRILSQHHHEYTAGLVGSDVEQAVRENRRYIAYSSYAYQLEPWLHACGAERVRVIPFERYVTDRPAVIRELSTFLGLAEAGLLDEPAQAANTSTNKPVRNRFWDGVYHHPVYRNMIRRVLPLKLRATLMRMALPKATARKSEAAPVQWQWLVDELAPDVRRLHELLPWESPFWPEFELSPKN